MADIHGTAEMKHKVEPKPLRNNILPSTYYLQCGITTTLRWIRMDEFVTFHKMFMQAMKSGHGYGADEYLTYSMFLKYQVNNLYSMVLEDEKNGTILGIVTGGQHYRVRGVTPYIAGASILINPESRGKGITTDMGTVWPSLLKHLGYRYLVGDSAMVNKRMRHAEYKCGYTAIGVVPYGLYLAKEGWMDVVISIKDLALVPDFSDVIHDSYERHKAELRAQVDHFHCFQYQ